MGQVMIPLMLFTLGVQLTSAGKFRFSADMVAASSIRLFGGPVVAMGLAVLFGITGMERGTGILQASMPIAVLVSIIALEYDILPGFITTSVLFSTLAGLVTITGVLYLV